MLVWTEPCHSARKSNRTTHSRSLVERLPPELLDHIGGYLEDDPRAVRACTLTCRGWYSTLRPHIYRVVTIRAPVQMDALEKLSYVYSSDLLCSGDALACFDEGCVTRAGPGLDRAVSR